MLVKELMSSSISCVGPSANVRDIAAQMKKNNTGAVPVCTDQGKLMGIITDRDLVLRCLAREQAPGATPLKAEDIMTTKAVTVSPDTNIHDAALMMSHNRIRRLPVMRNERLIGMFSLGDLAREPVFADEGGDVLCAVSSDEQ